MPGDEEGSRRGKKGGRDVSQEAQGRLRVTLEG